MRERIGSQNHRNRDEVDPLNGDDAILHHSSIPELLDKDTECEPISEYEHLSPVRLIGAELASFIASAERAESHQSAEPPPFARFINHIGCFSGDMRHGKKERFIAPNVAATLQQLLTMKLTTAAYMCGDICLAEFRRDTAASYLEMSRGSVFQHIPAAAETLGLTLLEFNTDFTDFSRLPKFLIPEIQRIERSVLINSSLGVPQNGLGREMRDDEADQLLRARGTRVFMLQSFGQSLGYYMFLPAPPAWVLPEPNLLGKLAGEGIIPNVERSRIGFFRSIAVSKVMRMACESAGINAHALLDDVMAQTAFFEETDTLICTVRVGKNLNTARYAHEKKGWVPTGYILSDATPGATPLEVMVRDLRSTAHFPAQFFPADRSPQLGFRPHFMPFIPVSHDDRRVVDAALISVEEAAARAEAFCDTLPFGWSVLAYHGSLQYYITFQASCGIHHNLHQLRPGFDQWYLLSDHSSGTLNECFQRILNIEFYPRRLMAND